MNWSRIGVRGTAGLALLSCAAAGATRQVPAQRAGAKGDLCELVAQFQAERGALRRFHDRAGSAARIARLRRSAEEWRAVLTRTDFEVLDQDGRIDWLLLRTELESDLAELAREERRAREEAPLVSYAERILELAEARQRVEPVENEQAAGELDALVDQVSELRKAQAENAEKAPEVSKAIAKRAAERVGELRAALRGWYEFRAGYDPLFTWWTRVPFEALEKELEQHAKFLREKLAGLAEDDSAEDSAAEDSTTEDDADTIVGDPIGRAALLEDLALAWIPYTPEELIQVAEREFSWCEAEMRRAAREMGCGDDWKQALERVKQNHVAPGEQPALIVALAREAWEYVEREELVSVPALAKEVWRVNMLSPADQRTSPFFLGGESMQVAYPTDAMSHEAKRMSLRGNNRHFCRATVHHEVIPGHHLQGFMNERYFTYRRAFSTPFWTEGWALWWEMLLWERGYVATPEDRVGALFWRMHRCARIQFSLGFHLGQMTPAQCIDFLVERVGHERENAEAEVRRSFGGDYGPLYQLAYMIGALQFRGLYAELVRSGKLSAREFHDAVLTSGNMPIELVRARLMDVALTPDTRPSWRFYALD
ncbi:MAG: DUF885 family protein [Planctomycetes bacterium]|nr:DUF885 family protein [Planctomycetota bacterium]